MPIYYNILMAEFLVREHGPVLFWLMIATTTAWEQPLFIAGGVGGGEGSEGLGEHIVLRRGRWGNQ